MSLRSTRFDTKVLGGYWCDAPNCKRMYICQYRDPCWEPRKKYGKPAAWLNLNRPPAGNRRRRK